MILMDAYFLYVTVLILINQLQERTDTAQTYPLPHCIPNAH